MAYMSQKGYDELVAKLQHMESVDRPAASAAIAEARDKGDLSENAEYDAAKEWQGKLETEIALLKKTIMEAHIEYCRASPKQNIDYIKKDGNIIYEYGEEPKQGKLNYNYDEVKNLTTKEILDNED